MQTAPVEVGPRYVRSTGWGIDDKVYCIPLFSENFVCAKQNSSNQNLK